MLDEAAVSAGFIVVEALWDLEKYYDTMNLLILCGHVYIFTHVCTHVYVYLYVESGCAHICSTNLKTPIVYACIFRCIYICLFAHVRVPVDQ